MKRARARAQVRAPRPLHPRQNLGLGRSSGILRPLLGSQRDAFYQEFWRDLLPDLPAPARGLSGRLPTAERYDDFEVGFVHRRNMADSGALHTRYSCHDRPPAAGEQCADPGWPAHHSPRIPDSPAGFLESRPAHSNGRSAAWRIVIERIGLAQVFDGDVTDKVSRLVGGVWDVPERPSRDLSQQSDLIRRWQRTTGPLAGGQSTINDVVCSSSSPSFSGVFVRHLTLPRGLSQHLSQSLPNWPGRDQMGADDIRREMVGFPFFRTDK